MRAILVLCFVLGLACNLWAAVQGDPKQPYRDRPGDRARSHVESIHDTPHNYTIAFHGTVDGTMTRMPIGYGAQRHGWQPNRAIVIENIGETDVVDPWLVVNGKRDWKTVERIVAEATRGYSNPADKARAIWEFQRRVRFHATTWDREVSDAVKALNVYGYTLCGNEAVIINDLWKTAGLRTRRGYPVGHCVSEAWYDGAFHLLDSDEHVICLKRDNQTIASCEDIVRDHDLVKRTHTYGIGRSDGRRTDEFSASLYGYRGKREGDYGLNTRHQMSLRLRPGESIQRRWDHVGKEYSAGTATKPGKTARDGNGTLIRWGPTAYANLCNGTLRYRPDLTRPWAEKGAAVVENAQFDPDSGSIRVVDSTKPARVVWQFASPYVFVGGVAVAEVSVRNNAMVRWQFSQDQKSWVTVGEHTKAGKHQFAVTLDALLSPTRRPDYQYSLRLDLDGDVVVDRVDMESNIQTSLLALPELEAGTNQIVYTDATGGPRSVQITHRWLERTAWHPPNAPKEAISPADGQATAGSQVTFQWSPAADPDGDRIVDYRFELSEHADMRWTLSPNFEKWISKTAFKGKNRWQVPYVGLLNPNTTYFWRVRALDATGLWGAWSPTHRFQVKAPGVPKDVQLISDGHDALKLTWRQNPIGATPAKYKVYGSDEKGFTASDTEYLVNRGKGFVRDMDDYRARKSDAPDAGMVEVADNLIGVTDAMSMRVVGPELTTAATLNRAYYRVVAVDESGNESGPSDYAEVPRPHLVNQPPATARVGHVYRFSPKLICSIGDLQCRRSPESSYNAAYWDREQYTFQAIELPVWLGLDDKTGVLSGTPSEAKTEQVSFDVVGPSDTKRNVSFSLVVTGED